MDRRPPDASPSKAHRRDEVTVRKAEGLEKLTRQQSEWRILERALTRQPDPGVPGRRRRVRHPSFSSRSAPRAALKMAGEFAQVRAANNLKSLAVQLHNYRDGCRETGRQ